MVTESYEPQSISWALGLLLKGRRDTWKLCWGIALLGVYDPDPTTLPLDNDDTYTHTVDG